MRIGLLSCRFTKDQNRQTKNSVVIRPELFCIIIILMEWYKAVIHTELLFGVDHRLIQVEITY